MIDLILYNDSNIIFIALQILVNIILTNSTEIAKKVKIFEKENTSSKEKFENKTINFFINVFCIIIMYFSYKIKSIFACLMILTIFVSFSGIFKNYAKDAIKLSYDSNQHYICASCFFVLLFSAQSCRIYISSFGLLPHVAKEILLLLYLIVKIILTIFFTLMNFSITISNLKMLFGKRLDPFIYHLKKTILVYNPKYYNFKFSSINNRNIVIIIDKIIFIITCPIFMVFNMILKLFKTLTSKIINGFIKIYYSLLNYDSNRNIIIKTILKISFIWSLIIVYICIIYEKNIFSNQIKEIYNLIVTVLLIPIIYDNIKSQNT